MGLFSCFRVMQQSDSIKNQLLDGIKDNSVTRDNTTVPCEAFKTLEADLLSLNGSWHTRLEGLLRAFLHSGLSVELYGVTAAEFAPLGQPGNPDTTRDSLLLRLLDSKGPVTQLAPAGRGSTSQQVVSAALPLIHSGVLAGALWVEDRREQLRQQAAPQPLLAAPGGSPRIARTHAKSAKAAVRRGASEDAAEASPAATVASALLRSDTSLRQLSFAASMCLAGSGSDTLSWLSEAVARLRSAPSMQALTAQLCACLEAHVRSKFVLEVAVSAALVPPPLVPAGQLPSGQESTAQTHQQQQPGAMLAAATALLLRVQSGDTGDAGDPHFEGGPAPAPAASSGSRRRGPTAQAPASPSNSIPHGVTTHFGFRAFPADESGGFPLSGPAAAGAAAAPLPAALTSHNSIYASGSCGRALTTTGTVVVPLSAAEAAAVTAAAAATSSAAALRADAFPLQHTLLLAVLEEQWRQQQQQQLPQQEGPQQPHHHQRPEGDGERPSAAGPRDSARAAAGSTRSGGSVGSAAATAAAAPPLPISVIENTHLYVQNVHKPWRDVWLLMGRQQAGGGAATPTGVLSHGGSLMTSMTSGSSARFSMPQSLALLTLGLGEGAALGLYLCFPRRLPGLLLEAVRASCQELMDKGLSHPIREQLDGPLAAEYDMLKAAGPGSYAVVRGVGMSEDLLHGGGGGGPRTSASSGLHTSRHTGFLDSLFRRRTTPAMTPPPSSGAQAVGAARRAYALFADVSGSGKRRRSLLVMPGDAEGLEGTGIDKLNRYLSASSSASRRRSLALVPRTGPASVASPARPLAESSPAGAASASANALNFAELLLASCQGETPADLCGTFGSAVIAGGAAGGGGGGGGGGLSAPATDGPFASIVTIASVDTAAHQRMDLLVNSIQATLQEAAADSAAVNCAGDLEQLELLEVLGRGGGGVVLKGLLSGSLPVAVKLVELLDDDAEQLDEQGMRVRRGMLRNAMELAVQSSLSHPNIVQFYGTFSNVVMRSRDTTAMERSRELDPSTLCLQVLQPDSPESAAAAAAGEGCSKVTCTLAEFCDRGSLADVLCSGTFPPRTPLSPPTTAAAVGARRRGSCVPIGSSYDMRGVYMTLLDVALALRHLHALHLVHRDVKPANLLLKSNPQDYRGFTVKLADFGFVLHLTEAAEDGGLCASVETPCGTLTHIAPECLQKRARVGTSADIYSFGILMWELLAGGARPFSNVALERIPHVVRAGARPPFAENVPPNYRALAHQCWRTDPRRRPHAAELVTAIGALLSALK